MTSICNLADNGSNNVLAPLKKLKILKNPDYMHI